MRAWGVALVLGLALVAGCGTGTAEKTGNVGSFRVDAAGTTITLEVTARPGATPRAEVLTQDSDAVVIKVRVAEPDGDDIGETYEVSVSLDEPLGGREVRTDDGVTVPPSPPS